MKGVERKVLDLFVLGAASGGGVEFGTIFGTLIVFLVLLFLLSKYAWGPLKNIMDEREQMINRDLDEAKRAREEATKLQEENERKLNEAKQEIDTMLTNAKNQAKTEKQAIIDEATMKSDQMLKDAQTEIQNEKDRAMNDINDKVAELSILIAEKVLNKEINDKDQKDLVEQYIHEAGDK